MVTPGAPAKNVAGKVPPPHRPLKSGVGWARNVHSRGIVPRCRAGCARGPGALPPAATFRQKSFRRFRWGLRLAESQLMYQPAGSPFAWAAESKMMYRLPPSSHDKKESPVADGLDRLPVKGSSPMVPH